MVRRDVAGGLLQDRRVELRVELGASYFPGRAGRFISYQSAGANVDVFLGYAAACWTLLSTTRFTLAPCAGVSVGRVHGASFGVTTPGEAAAPYVTLNGAGRLTTRLSTHVSLLVGLEGAVSVARPELVVTGIGPLYSPNAIVMRLSAGPEFRF